MFLPQIAFLCSCGFGNFTVSYFHRHVLKASYPDSTFTTSFAIVMRMPIEVASAKDQSCLSSKICAVHATRMVSTK